MNCVYIHMLYRDSDRDSDRERATPINSNAGQTDAVILWVSHSLTI